MADFCRQCAIELWGHDNGDLAGLQVGPLPLDHGWEAICEGCGITVVDAEGNCLQPHCLKKHGF